MLLLESALKARLQTLVVLAGWHVRGASEHCDRSQIPAIEIRMVGAAPGDVSREAAQLEPRWSCVLVAKRSAQAAVDLDAVITAVIGGLHGFKPVSSDGRTWSELKVAGVREAEFSDAGLVGYSVEFTCVSVFESPDG